MISHTKMLHELCPFLRGSSLGIYIWLLAHEITATKFFLTSDCVGMILRLNIKMAKHNMVVVLAPHSAYHSLRFAYHSKEKQKGQ